MFFNLKVARPVIAPMVNQNNMMNPKLAKRLSENPEEMVSKSSSNMIEGRIIQNKSLIFPRLRRFKIIPKIANTGKIITAEMNQSGSFLRIGKLFLLTFVVFSSISNEV